MTRQTLSLEKYWKLFPATLTQDRDLHANQLSRLKAEVASSGILVKNCEYDHEHKKEDEKKISVDMPLTTLESNFNFSSSEYINI